MYQESPFNAAPASSYSILTESRGSTFLASQAATTRLIAKILGENGWTVVFTCIPNTPHIGVVPIPTKNASSAQRYPDILSFRQNTVRLSEVEISLSQQVVTKAIERFREQTDALRSPKNWLTWRERIKTLTLHELPNPSLLQCELVTCSPIRRKHDALVSLLLTHDIHVYSPDTYKP